MRTLVFPYDPPMRAVFGADLRDPQHDIRERRVYRARLERAQERGTLPARVYPSPRLFGWDAVELAAALQALPRTHAGSMARLQESRARTAPVTPGAGLSGLAQASKKAATRTAGGV